MRPNWQKSEKNALEIEKIDLIVGKNNQVAMLTLVERETAMVMI